MQVETHLRRQKLKNEDLAVVKEWRKNQKRGANDADFPEELLDPKNKKRKELLDRAGPVKVGALRASKKRQAKDAKYGGGGEKRFKKDNDKDSSADMSGFSRRRNAAGTGPSSRKPGMKNGFPMSPERKGGRGGPNARTGGPSGGFGARPKKTATRRPGKDARTQRR